MKHGMFQTVKSLARLRENFERQEQNCFQKVAKETGLGNARTSLWKVYRMQIGQVTVVGISDNERGSAAPFQLFYNPDVFRRSLAPSDRDWETILFLPFEVFS